MDIKAQLRFDLDMAPNDMKFDLNNSGTPTYLNWLCDMLEVKTVSHLYTYDK